MVTAADRGPPPPVLSEESPSGIWHAATAEGCGGAIPHPPRGIPHGAPAATPGPPRRRSTDTHVSQEQRDAAHDRDRAPAPRREALVPVGDTREAAPRAPRGPRHWDGRLFCGHDARIPFSATCAACFLWHEFKNTLLLCGHDPDDPSPSWCDVCWFYFEGLDERNGRPRRLACGQPAACPTRWGSCSHCLRASCCTHGMYDFLFCGHTLDRPGRNCPSRAARRNLHGAGGGMHVISAHHLHGGAAAVNRSRSLPNRHDVMIGHFGRRDEALEAGQRLMWLEAVWRVTGVDPRELRPHNSDRLRRGSRSVAHAGGRRDVPDGGAGRMQIHRSRRTEEQDGRWVRDTYSLFEGREGRLGGAVSVREGVAVGGRPAAGPLGRELRRVSVASSSPSEDAGEEPPGSDDGYRERAGGPRGGVGGRSREREPGNGDGSRAPPGGGDRGDDDDDDDDGGPARGGGRVATLWPGPMARGRQEPEGQGPHGVHASQTGPAGSTQTADGGAQMPATAEVQAHADGEDNPQEDAWQGDTGAREWGWWNTGTWQSGSSGSGWWDRPEGDDDGDDAWSRWIRGRRAQRTGGYGGYGGADRPRPKPAHTAAALEHHLTREQWIEELIADPPNPAHPEFRAPGSWERWVRGAFFTYTGRRGTPSTG